MEHPRVRPRPPQPESTPGVYASLDELIRLQYKAIGFSFLPRQPVHSILAGRHASRLRGRGLNFEEIRRYLPGDDIRNMDWKVTARTRQAHVRVYTEERDRPVLLIVDQRRSMFFGSRRAMKSVVAAEAAALGAWRTLSVGDRVGAIVFDDRDVVEIRPHRSRQRVMEVLRTIVAMNHRLRVANEPSNAGMLNKAVARASRVASHDHLICLISDGFGADDETVQSVTTASEHNDVLTVFIYDPLEARLPDAGRLVVAEAGRQLELDTSDESLRDRFAADFQRRLDRMQEISRRKTIPLLPVETGAGVAEQVRRLLGQRPTQRGR